MFQNKRIMRDFDDIFVEYNELVLDHFCCLLFVIVVEDNSDTFPHRSIMGLYQHDTVVAITVQLFLQTKRYIYAVGILSESDNVKNVIREMSTNGELDPLSKAVINCLYFHVERLPCVLNNDNEAFHEKKSISIVLKQVGGIREDIAPQDTLVGYYFLSFRELQLLPNKLFHFWLS